MPVGVHTGRDESEHADDPAAFAHLQNERVGGQERAPAGVGQAVGADCSTCASRSLAISATCNFDEDVIPRDCTRLSVRRVETPSR